MGQIRSKIYDPYSGYFRLTMLMSNVSPVERYDTLPNSLTIVHCRVYLAELFWLLQTYHVNE